MNNHRAGFTRQDVELLFGQAELENRRPNPGIGLGVDIQNSHLSKRQTTGIVGELLGRKHRPIVLLDEYEQHRELVGYVSVLRDHVDYRPSKIAVRTAMTTVCSSAKRFGVPVRSRPFIAKLYPR